WLLYARALAQLSAPTILRAAPILAAALLFLGMRPPASALHGLVFALALLQGLLLSAALVTLLSISLFWTVSGEGVARLLPAAVWMLSGIVIPLPFFPERLRWVLGL